MSLASSRFASNTFRGSTAFANRGAFSSPLNLNSGLVHNQLGGFRSNQFGNNLGFNRFGFGNRFRFNRPFGFGCFGCGFGIGFGFGWWGPGFGWWDPFWFEPWYDPWGGVGLNGYYAYPPYDYGAPDGYDSSSLSYNNSTSGADNSSGAYENAPAPLSAPSADVTAEATMNHAAALRLYLKNGAAFDVTDYWVADNKLNFVVANGVEFGIELDQLDLQRTVDENAKRGIQFILQPDPNGSTGAPKSETPAY